VPKFQCFLTFVDTRWSKKNKKKCAVTFSATVMLPANRLCWDHNEGNPDPTVKVGLENDGFEKLGELLFCLQKLSNPFKIKLR
jgi:hypothetical protein